MLLSLVPVKGINTQCGEILASVFGYWAWVEFVGGSMVQSVLGGTSGVHIQTVKG